MKRRSPSEGIKRRTKGDVYMNEGYADSDGDEEKR